MKKKKHTGKVVAVLAVAALAGGYYQWKKKAASEVEHATVKTAEAEKGTVRATVSANGKLQAFTTVDVKSKAGGKVIKMAVEEGTIVKAGDLIALIDRTDTTAQYRQASADAAAARGAVAQSQATLSQQRAGLGPQIRQSAESVSAAQARLAQTRQALRLQAETNGPQIHQSEESVAAASARAAQAQQALELQKLTSESAVAEAQSAIKAAEARLEQARSQAKTQPELTRAQVASAQAQLESAEANLAASRESLSSLQSASQPQQTAKAQADVDLAKSEVENTGTNLKRLQGLLEKGFVAQNQVDNAQNTHVAAKSRLSTVQSVLNTLKEQQTANLREAKARVDSAQGGVHQARAALENAKANTVQIGLKEKDVEAAQAALAQAQTGLESAKNNRAQIGLKEAELKAAKATLAQTKAALLNTKANTRQVEVKRADVVAADAAVRQAQAALANTRTQAITSQARAADVDQARARLTRAQVTQQNAQTNLDETRVYAPRDGIVVQKYVDEGTIIQSGTSGFSGGNAIVQLAQVDRMYIDTEVDEADIALISEGQHVDITLDAYPNSPMEGKVLRIYPMATELQNVTYIHVKVEVDAMAIAERTLRPGMNASCEFLVDEKTDVLRVPSEAVKDSNDIQQVTVIKDPKKDLWDTANHDVRKVEIGLRGDEYTEILPGEKGPVIKTGETVITSIVEPITATPPSGMNSGAPRGPTSGMPTGGGRR